MAVNRAENQLESEELQEHLFRTVHNIQEALRQIATVGEPEEVNLEATNYGRIKKVGEKSYLYKIRFYPDSESS